MSGWAKRRVLMEGRDDKPKRFAANGAAEPNAGVVQMRASTGGESFDDVALVRSAVKLLWPEEALGYSKEPGPRNSIAWQRRSRHAREAGEFLNGFTLAGARAHEVGGRGNTRRGPEGASEVAQDNTGMSCLLWGARQSGVLASAFETARVRPRGGIRALAWA